MKNWIVTIKGTFNAMQSKRHWLILCMKRMLYLSLCLKFDLNTILNTWRAKREKKCLNLTLRPRN